MEKNETLSSCITHIQYVVHDYSKNKIISKQSGSLAKLQGQKHVLMDTWLSWLTSCVNLETKLNGRQSLGFLM